MLLKKIVMLFKGHFMGKMIIRAMHKPKITTAEIA
jgi:hypothetical protein